MGLKNNTFLKLHSLFEVTQPTLVSLVEFYIVKVLNGPYQVPYLIYAILDLHDALWPICIM